MAIRNPIEWSLDQLHNAGVVAGAANRAVRGIQDLPHTPMPAVRRIGLGDVRGALVEGLADFGAYRTDVLFLCAIYPIVGIVLARLALGNDLLPLLLPLGSGFALIGPFAAIGLYELSRRRERGRPVAWRAAFNVVHAPGFGAMLVLGLGLVALFLMWLVAAQLIYDATLGPQPPVSAAAFLQDLFGTAAGWRLIVIGNGVGLLFALAAMSVSVVSFPLLLDREIRLETAVATSVRAVAANPVPMAAWGLTVAAGLVLGAIPLLVGLIVVMPVLGHATWHLYRRLVVR